MREKHEKETALKAKRDSMAKDATDREAAAQVCDVACTITSACTYCNNELKAWQCIAVCVVLCIYAHYLLRQTHLALQHS